MSNRWQGGFIQAYFDPLTEGPLVDFGPLYAWGQNVSGFVGDNTTIDRSSPVQIGSLTTWSQVSAGSSHNAAVKTDGTLWAWGNNALLGVNDTIYRSSPVQVGALTDWASVDNRMESGSETAVATRTNLTMWAWGKNNLGQFGLNNTFAGTYSSPVQIGVGKDWSGVQVGNDFIVALESP